MHLVGKCVKRPCNLMLSQFSFVTNNPTIIWGYPFYFVGQVKSYIEAWVLYRRANEEKILEIKRKVFEFLKNLIGLKCIGFNFNEYYFNFVFLSGLCNKLMFFRCSQMIWWTLCQIQLLMELTINVMHKVWDYW